MKLYRKVLSTILSVLIIVTCFSIPALADTPVFSLSQTVVSVAANSEFEVTINVNNADLVRQLCTLIEFDSNEIELVGAEMGDVVTAEDRGLSIYEDISESSGLQRYVIASSGSPIASLGSGSGSIMTCKFKAKSTATSGAYDIIFHGDSDTIGKYNSTASGKDVETAGYYRGMDDNTKIYYDSMKVTVNITNTSSQTGTLITADTSSLSTLYPGDIFSVPVMISENSGIWGGTNTITYESSVLNFTGAVKGNDAFSSFTTNADQILFEGSGAMDANITDNGTLYTLNFEVKDNAAAGTYPISLSGDISDNEGNPVNISYVSGSVTVAEKVVPAGYSVNVTADSDQVTTGGTVKVNLDITNGDGKTTFNDMQDVVLTYDSTNFTFDQANSTLQGFEATDSNGTLTIHGYGPTVNLDDSAAEIVLAFTAGSVEKDNCEFTLNSAKIDDASNADQNISEVSAINGKPTVSIVKPYVVTFHANGHGTDPAAQNVKIGGKATKPENLTETGWNFEGWYTEEACENEYDFSQEVTGDLELFAKWTEVQEETSIDEIITSEYNTIGDYTLVKVTVKNPGTHVPNYDGETMYKVPNIEGADFYDQDAYYCVVKDYNAEKVGLTEGTSVKEIDKTTYKGDANMTHFVDINDAQFAYNLYNTGTISVTYTPTAEQLLSSDVNGDGTVDVNDCNAVITAMS